MSAVAVQRLIADRTLQLSVAHSDPARRALNGKRRAADQWRAARRAATGSR